MENPNPETPPADAVLLLEDDESVLKVIALLLESAGHTVLPAQSESEALAASDGHQGDISIMLTDVKLRGGNGPDVAARLLQRRPRMRIVYMSGYPPEEFSFPLPLRENDGFQAKPFDLRRFSAMIEGRAR